MFLEFWEDIEIGRCENLGQYQFTKENICHYAKKYDPQRFHLSDVEAKKTHFGALCASGWHIAGAFMICYMTYIKKIRHSTIPPRQKWPQLGPSPGVKNLQWKKPVYVNDTLSFHAEICAKRHLNTYPEWGLVEFYARGLNQKKEDVFSFEAFVFCAKLVARKRNENM